MRLPVCVARGGGLSKRQLVLVQRQSRDCIERCFASTASCPLQESHDCTPQQDAMVVEIDAGVLGGGHVALRNSLIYASLLQRSVHITNIRVGCERPGLKSHEVLLWEVVETLFGGNVANNTVGSTTVSYTPSPRDDSSGKTTIDTTDDDRQSEEKENGILDDERNNDNVKGYDEFDDRILDYQPDCHIRKFQQTVDDDNGTTLLQLKLGHTVPSTLVLQTLLPLCLFRQSPIRIEITGGCSNSSKSVLKQQALVDSAPMYEYFVHVFLHTLQTQCGINVSTQLHRRSFFPKGHGHLELTVIPQKDATLEPIVITQRGMLEEIRILGINSSRVPKHHCLFKAVQTCEKALHRYAPTTCKLVNESNDRKYHGGIAVLAMAQTSAGHILCGSSSKSPTPTGRVGERVGTAAAFDLLHNLRQDIGVDRYLQDQLILYMSLANGTSEILCGDTTVQTLSAIRLAQQFTNATFDIQELTEKRHRIICTGIGYKAG